jgi:hypothetical protein
MATVVAEFGGRRWHPDAALDLSNREESGQAVVIPGKPFPMLQVRVASGTELVLHLLVEGCN